MIHLEVLPLLSRFSALWAIINAMPADQDHDVAWNLPVIGDGLAYCEQFLPSEAADCLLQALLSQVPWQQSEIRIFGRQIPEPRLSCWMGDPQAVYRYSGTVFNPRSWITPVTELRQAIEARTGHRFNSVLLNYYRTGQDAMGWHSDDEPELGHKPVIASVSLGGVRRFLLREKRPGARAQSIPLAHGSLLLMYGNCQNRYQHSLPRTRRAIDGRINLTFRHVRAAESSMT
jgi:alkylated DNA repair dioxygenase AlkB